MEKRLRAHLWPAAIVKSLGKMNKRKRRRRRRRSLSEKHRAKADYLPFLATISSTKKHHLQVIKDEKTTSRSSSSGWHQESIIKSTASRASQNGLARGRTWRLLMLLSCCGLAECQSSSIQHDPRPTIYSGQVSFGLLLSAHSSLGAEPSTSASQQVMSLLMAPHANQTSPLSRSKRQIFDHQFRGRQGNQQQDSKQPQAASSTCSQVNANALYAGMGAIWASHQANLVGDSQLTIGTYVYDSCNDLDVGQRQSVRIVSNLNAFQQTTCESPRGSPISLTIAHGDNQLRAIQLLASFRVPVIATKEPFSLEDYHLLTREQRRYLFTTAPSSRQLAVGALKFGRLIVDRSKASPKLPNQYFKMSSKNGLIVISRNLPSRFISYLTSTIPQFVNYEMLQSSQPIEQIKSIETLESILIKPASSESRQVLSRLEAPAKPVENQDRRRRRSPLDSDADSNGEYEANADDSLDNSRMLSPTILMFITPSEAIDLVTRLRNDLSEVSRYYSLIVTTSEDISPALRTIFRGGGSRLCSGKAFYTISPRPDDIGEFSRYFRDTVQMEGESSDHPLICEFAKHQAGSRLAADLDDLGTEPVIKAVWSAAAAFKAVHRHSCGSLAPISNADSKQQANSMRADQVEPLGRTISSRQSGSGGSGGAKSAHAECLVKMNKNMSNLVQRALKRLEVTINSTGLQALDGFKLKFDDTTNELLTNKFSIKYVNKECEITEIGQYTGFKESRLHIDESALTKSLEGSMPDSWPARPAPTPAPTSAPTTKSSEPPASSNSADSSGQTSGGQMGGDSTPATDVQGSGSQHKERRGEPADESPAVNEESPGESSDLTTQEAVKQNRKRSRDEVKLRGGDKRRLPVSTETTQANGLADTTVAPTTRLPASSVNSTTVKNETTSQTLPSYMSTTTTSTTEQPTTTQRKLKSFPSPEGTTLKDWLPVSKSPETVKSLAPVGETQDAFASTTMTSKVPHSTSSEGSTATYQELDPLRSQPTTRTPSYSTPPEIDAELLSTVEHDPMTSRKPNSRFAKSASNKLGRALDQQQQQPQPTTTTAQQTAAENVDQVTAATSSTTNHKLSGQIYPLSYGQEVDFGNRPLNLTPTTTTSVQTDSPFNINDLNMAPIPLSSLASSQDSSGGQMVDLARNGRIKSGRSQIKWIYSSWYALSILGANILGALMTLYVLTFLLMKNCDGSLDRDSQGVRSMHLLSVIVVFFGSTLFIVYPTPGLCLLRTSWHNFSLVMLFGSLLLQAMQTRSQNSLGLGGRSNRVNQLLTLLFMVGVQVSFEFQRWKYESANYMSFLGQYFVDAPSTDKRKATSNAMTNSHISEQFNPLNSFTDQITPMNIQQSEQYQTLLQDYCLKQSDDFVQSQFYLCIIVILLILFNLTNRRKSRLSGASSASHKFSSTLSSGKLVASQHEANLDLSPSHFQFASGSQVGASASGVGSPSSNMFMVTLICALIYFMSFVLQVHGQNSTTNKDLISSVTMVLIAFTTLIGVFLPILVQIHRNEGISMADRLTNSLMRGATSSKSKNHHSDGRRSIQGKEFGDPINMSSSSSAFAMFPEFAPTGLRRPSSVSGDSSSGADSRRMFASTKESRRNMGATLADLGPSADSLRSMGFYNGESRSRHESADTDVSGVELHSPADVSQPKLNLSAIDEPAPRLMSAREQVNGRQHGYRQHHHHHNSSSNNHGNNLLNAHDSHHNNNHPTASRRTSTGEKRLIMLDVDPCCPRHGHSAWPLHEDDQSPRASSRGKHGVRCKSMHAKR